MERDLKAYVPDVVRVNDQITLIELRWVKSDSGIILSYGGLSLVDGDSLVISRPSLPLVNNHPFIDLWNERASIKVTLKRLKQLKSR
jgi:hypothetical protein